MKTKILIIYASVTMLWANLAYSQPVVRVYLAEDSLAIHQQVSQYLHYFDITEDIFISVIFAKHMPEDTEGMTFVVKPINPFPYRIIKVRIASRVSEKRKRLILAHEMVHVKQYVKSELEIIDGQNVKWKGKTFCNYFLGKHQRSSPWEREAYRADNTLLKTFKETEHQPLLAENPGWFANWFSNEKDSVGALQVTESIYYE